MTKEQAKTILDSHKQGDSLLTATVKYKDMLSLLAKIYADFENRTCKWSIQTDEYQTLWESERDSYLQGKWKCLGETPVKKGGGNENGGCKRHVSTKQTNAR